MIDYLILMLTWMTLRGTDEPRRESATLFGLTANQKKGPELLSKAVAVARAWALQFLGTAKPSTAVSSSDGTPASADSHTLRFTDLHVSGVIRSS